MIDPHDSARWDNIHSQLTKEDQKPSEYARRVEQMFHRGSQIAELGGGTGADAVYFMLKGHTVVVFDISEIAIATTEKLAKVNKVDNLLKTRQIDFTFQNLPLEHASVDIVYSRISLNYFTAMRTIEILKEINRVIKPGGKAFLTFKSPDDPKEMAYLKERCSVYEPMVYIDNGQMRSRFTKEKLTELLKKADITTATVNPHEEVLGVDNEGNKNHLYVNEIYFTKS